MSRISSRMRCIISFFKSQKPLAFIISSWLAKRARDEPEHSRFATARGAEQRANLAFLYVERHVAHRLDRRSIAEIVAFANVAHRQFRHARRC